MGAIQFGFAIGQEDHEMQPGSQTAPGQMAEHPQAAAIRPMYIFNNQQKRRPLTDLFTQGIDAIIETLLLRLWI